MAETWRVVAQRDSFGMVGGRLVPVVVVSVETIDGDTFEVEIPRGQFSAEAAAELIEAEAAERVKLRRL